MKWIRVLENRLYPNESPYQRLRRRYFFWLTITCVAGMVLAAMIMIHEFAGKGGLPH